MDRALDYPRLRNFDMNLLLAFDALMQTQSVTRAAQLLRLGQPAMSAALGRLRDAFEDPLFVRTGQRMEPTPRAQRLHGVVRELLVRCQRDVLEQDGFDPTHSQRGFGLAVTEYEELIVVPYLMERVLRAAPRVCIDLHNLAYEQVVTGLREGNLDAAVGVYRGQVSWIRSEPLMRDTLSCLFHRRQVRARPPVDLDTFVRLPHVLVTQRGDRRGRVDEGLEALGRGRHIAMTTPHFSALPTILVRCRALVSLPRRLAELFRGQHTGLAISPLPCEVPPFEVSIMWHAKNDSDPGLAWLRAQIRAVVEEYDTFA